MVGLTRARLRERQPFGRHRPYCFAVSASVLLRGVSLGFFFSDDRRQLTGWRSHLYLIQVLPKSRCRLGKTTLLQGRQVFGR
jgi:hypothetical protein